MTKLIDRSADNCYVLFAGSLNLPDSMDVLDGIADLFPQLLLVKLHLRHSTKKLRFYLFCAKFMNILTHKQTQSQKRGTVCGFVCPSLVLDL